MKEPATPRPVASRVTLAGYLSLLEAGEGDVQANISSLLGRADLTIAYWLADAESWVDREGGRVVLDQGDPAVTVISRRGQRVAALRGETPLPRLDTPLEAVVGRLTVQSAEGAGTTVHAAVPLVDR